MKLSAAITLLFVLSAMVPARGGDAEGWATCSSVAGGDYALTGGGDGSMIVLRNDGTDMCEAIANAVATHDVIVFDGSNGDFVLPRWVSFNSLKNRTFVGVNGACLRSEFTVTQEIRDLLDSLNVNSLSSNSEDNLGGTLSNGVKVAEQCELTVRQALIDLYGDPGERYRESGVFVFNGCSNIIVSNLDFAGPGSIDVGGADLITLNGCDHVWVDHCRFTDGMDGNLDIINNSDLITVSDTWFRYTPLSYNHPLSNLNSGYALTDGSPQKNNISWIRCFWDEGCRGRMPLTGFGTHHILNCFWDCTGGTCVDSHDLSQVLVEQSYFANKVKQAVAIRQDNVTLDWRGSVWERKMPPASTGTVSAPYAYGAMAAPDVPETIRANAGPKGDNRVARQLSASPSVIDFGNVYAGNEVGSRVTVSAYGDAVPERLTLTAPAGILLSSAPGGDYGPTLVVEAVDATLIQAEVYVKARFDEGGSVAEAIEVSAPDESLSIPVRAEVVALDGQREDASVTWPTAGVSIVSTHSGVFSGSSRTLGDKLSVKSSTTIGGTLTFTLFNPTEAIGKLIDDDCCVAFDVVAAPGYVFVPNTLKLNAARVGTDMCLIGIECARDSGEPQRLLADFQPVRSSDAPYYSEIELPLANAGVGDRLRIKVKLYNMTANKQLALGNVRVDGILYAPGAGAEPVTVDCDVAGAEYFDLTGRRVAHPVRGRLYLIRDGRGHGALSVY